MKKINKQLQKKMLSFLTKEMFKKWLKEVDVDGLFIVWPLPIAGKIQEKTLSELIKAQKLANKKYAR